MTDLAAAIIATTQAGNGNGNGRRPPAATPQATLSDQLLDIAAELERRAAQKRQRDRRYRDRRRAERLRSEEQWEHRRAERRAERQRQLEEQDRCPV
jgi:hypothetical protein